MEQPLRPVNQCVICKCSINISAMPQCKQRNYSFKEAYQEWCHFGVVGVGVGRDGVRLYSTYAAFQGSSTLDFPIFV